MRYEVTKIYFHPLFLDFFFDFWILFHLKNVQASHELSIFGFTQKAGCQAKIIGKSLILFNQPQNQNYPAPPPQYPGAYWGIDTHKEPGGGS